MGDVNKGERTYRNLTLSDIKVVELLIRHRDKLDPTFMTEQNTILDCGSVFEVNGELISLYASLDYLIDKCNLGENQKTIIKMIQYGYTLKEIGDKLDKSHQNIDKIFQRVCKRIADLNNSMWAESVHKSILGTPTKQCNKCKRDLPMTIRFFSVDKRNRDGLRGTCKSCNTYTKKG